MARVRRTKKEILTAKAAKIDEQIRLMTEKLEKLRAEKEAIDKRFAELDAAARKAEEEAKMKELIKAIRTSGKSVDEIRAFLEA